LLAAFCILSAIILQGLTAVDCRHSDLQSESETGVENETETTDCHVLDCGIRAVRDAY